MKRFSVSCCDRSSGARSLPSARLISISQPETTLTNTTSFADSIRRRAFFRKPLRILLPRHVARRWMPRSSWWILAEVLQHLQLAHARIGLCPVLRRTECAHARRLLTQRAIEHALIAVAVVDVGIFRGAVANRIEGKDARVLQVICAGRCARALGRVVVTPIDGLACRDPRRRAALRRERSRASQAVDTAKPEAQDAFVRAGCASAPIAPPGRGPTEPIRARWMHLRVEQQEVSKRAAPYTNTRQTISYLLGLLRGVLG